MVRPLKGLLNEGAVVPTAAKGLRLVWGRTVIRLRGWGCINGGSGLPPLRSKAE